MSVQLSSYWEPIDFRSDFPPDYTGGEDRGHPNKYFHRELIADPEPQNSLVTSLLIVFVLASGVFFATMSLAFLEVQMTVETLRLPYDHQVLSDLRRIEHGATLVSAAVCLGLAVLAIGGQIYLSTRDTYAH